MFKLIFHVEVLMRGCKTVNGSCNYNPDMCRKGIGCFNFLVRHSSLFLHTIRPLAMGNVLVDKGPLLLNSVLS